MGAGGMTSQLPPSAPTAFPLLRAFREGARSLIPPSSDLAFALVSDPMTEPLAMMLDFYPRKSPGRWAFLALWSWGESNPRVSDLRRC